MCGTRRWLATFAATMGLIGVVGSGAVRAQDGDAAGGGRALLGVRGPLRKVFRESVSKLRGLKEELNLTPEQKAEIARILKAHREEIVRAVQDVHEKRRALMKEVRSDDYSERAIRRAARDLADAIGDASVLRARIRKEVRAVLTAEQRRKADRVLEDIQRSVDDVMDDLG